MSAKSQYKWKQYKNQQGQSMVELALSVPFLFLILFAILFFGRYFLISQILLVAAQEGAKVASRTPNLSTDSVRDSVRGFTTGGSAINSNSVIYAAIASARLLSQGITGDMPPGTKVEILPWDSDGSVADTIPAGTVEVRIDYPFELAGNPFTSSVSDQSNSVAVAMSFNKAAAIRFSNFTITQRAVSAQEVYQN